MTPTTVRPDRTAVPESPAADHLPAYRRTLQQHPGIQPFEAEQRFMEFLWDLNDADPREARTMLHLIFEQGDPKVNGTVTPEQALLIARQARRFDREGDTHMRDKAELALNGSGMLLDDVLPTTAAESIQADREGRRMRELRQLLLASQKTAKQT